MKKKKGCLLHSPIFICVTCGSCRKSTSDEKVLPDLCPFCGSIDFMKGKLYTEREWK